MEAKARAEEVATGRGGAPAQGYALQRAKTEIIGDLNSNISKALLSLGGALVDQIVAGNWPRHRVPRHTVILIPIRMDVSRCRAKSEKALNQYSKDGILSVEELLSLRTELTNAVRRFDSAVKYYLDICGKFIENDETGEFARLSIAERWEMLDKFAAAFPGVPVSSLGQRLFPQPLEAAQAPAAAASVENKGITKLWVERDPGDTPVSFIQKHYGRWVDDIWDRDGLTKSDLRRADIQLYNALATWESRHHDDRLNLPSQKEEVNRWVDRMTNGEEAPTTAAEKERLRSAQRRRATVDRA